MSSHDFVLFALQIAAMLAWRLMCGQIMRKLGQPAVLGEMIGGIILGQRSSARWRLLRITGCFTHPPTSLSCAMLTIKLGMMFFLFIAGLEVDLNPISAGSVRRPLPSAWSEQSFRLLPAWAWPTLMPSTFWGPGVQGQFFAFALFLGLNLANSANP